MKDTLLGRLVFSVTRCTEDINIKIRNHTTSFSFEELFDVQRAKPDGRDIQSHIYSLLLPILSLPSFIIYLFYLYLPSLIRQVSRWINLSLCLLGRLQSGEKANLIVKNIYVMTIINNICIRIITGTFRMQFLTYYYNVNN